MHAELFRNNVRDIVQVFHVLVIIKKHIPAVGIFYILFNYALLAEAGVGRVQNTHLTTRLILWAVAKL